MICKFGQPTKTKGTIMITTLELVLSAALIATVIFSIRFCVHHYRQQR